MSNCVNHAVSAARHWGGEPDEYIEIEKWFDEPKGVVADFRQRALRHHSFGIQEAVEKFGDWITLSTGKRVGVALICERHMFEDFGRIPSVHDWLMAIQPEPWMASAARKLSRELADA